ILMYIVYYFNKKLAEKVKSPGLLAAAKDNRSDAWTSIGTAIAVFAASFQLGWLDTVAAMVVGLLILKTAVDIFRESSFSLSDGFDQAELVRYKETIEKIPEVRQVKDIRGRNYGSNIYVDITVLMDSDLTVKESHTVSDIIEHRLFEKFQVHETDVHVEPFVEK
ncbi:cation diffusion facilitator family transporter, partial [Enterococcus faecium]|uniref:cation diffusion facilitator family transporter n=2 Tax=Enterococcus TaxID=1350 RepID=UPI00187E9723